LQSLLEPGMALKLCQAGARVRIELEAFIDETGTAFAEMSWVFKL
jgi:hypothetical protein